MAGNESDCETEQPALQSQCSRRRIIIQLTGTEGEWDHLDGSEHVDSEGQNLLSPEAKPLNSVETDDNNWGLQSPGFHVPLSPSTPDSLGACSSSSLGFLSPSHRPLTSLVKSLSTELELKDNSSLKPRPLLSLVKSISTELSRSSPDLSQSKSDSKLNLHLWTQLTQSSRSGDSHTAPPSPVSQSPSKPKEGLFKVELEDSCRKLSEVMQEPLGVFSKFHKATSSVESLGKELARSSGESPVVEPPVGERKRLAMCNWTVRPCRACQLSKTGDEEPTEVLPHKDTTNKNIKKACSSVPSMVLCCVAAFSYCYLVLPLSSFWSGMFAGLAFGLMLGLLFIQLGPAKQLNPGQSYRIGNTNDRIQNEHTLQGWLNVMFTYDPETYRPSLMHSVYATLDGPRLRLHYPSICVPCWASYSEPTHDQSFTHTRMFNLVGTKVFLLPTVLACKRLWNKKYPICVTLAWEEKLEKEVLTKIDTISEKPTFLTDDSVSTTNRTTTLYLFGRSGREKEEWFQHLLLASTYEKEVQSDTSDTPAAQQDIPACGAENISSGDPVGRGREGLLLDYTSYMNELISGGPARASCHNGGRDGPTANDQTVCYHERDSHPAWINALIGRLFWDFLQEKDWADHIANKIQRKLSKIRLPYFMDELTVTELSMGSHVPRITDTFLPQVNARGLWIHLEVEYTGALKMTLETKINLSRLVKEEPEVDEMQICHMPTRSKLALLADSDEESSSAGSSDEEKAPSAKPQGNVGEKGIFPAAESTGRRILRFVDRIAKSRCIQKATENEFIKKNMEKMSNMPLLLTVEVKELSGTLAVNVPPPPSDRLWYGFCVPPKLDLCVRPKLGELEVTICHVTEWIEKKLQDEFQKVFVLPNMDDVYLPLMRSSIEAHPPPSPLNSCEPH